MTTLPDPNSLSLPQFFASLAATGLVRRLFELARDEDLGTGPHRGDITTSSWSPADEQANLALVARSSGVLAGLAALPLLCEVLSPDVRITPVMADGGRVARGDRVAAITGPARQALLLERTMLNLVSRLSGVATLTATYVAEASRGGDAGVFDTRKTTPGLRVLEKYAVRCGGGRTHRLGLYDAALYKDNHLAHARSHAALAARLSEASARARADRPLAFVEVEADSLDQLGVFLALPAGTIDVVLLDNMTAAQLRDAVARRNATRPDVQLEASGGVTLSTIREIASTGVERISVGALTHSAVSLDFGLDAI